MIDTFLKSIRQLRRREGLTQESLARVVGVAQARISGMENGEGNPTIETVRAVADALDAEIVIVPRRILKSVKTMVEDYLEPGVRDNRDPGSALDDVFIPDDADPDEETEEHRSYRPRGMGR